jgi:hypothetical protein
MAEMLTRLPLSASFASTDQLIFLLPISTATPLSNIRDGIRKFNLSFPPLIYHTGYLTVMWSGRNVEVHSLAKTVELVKASGNLR